MAECGVPEEGVINAGGIPQNNAVLNRVYAKILGKPVLVPNGVPTSLGSGMFALVAAGVFPSIDAAQKKMCLGSRVYEPDGGRSHGTPSYSKCISLRTSISGNVEARLRR